MRNRLLLTYKKNFKLLFRIVYGIIPNTDDTKDILQDVAIKIMNNKCELTEKHLLPWCITVAKNTAIDYIRKHHKPQISYNPQSHFNSTSFIESEYDCSFLELRIIIFDYLSTLDPKIQQSLYLNLFENRSAKQISEITNIDYNKIRHIIWKEKKQLRRIIESI